MFIQENRERLEGLLSAFYYTLDSMDSKPSAKIIESFLNSEESAEKGMAEYFEGLKQIEKSDKRLLRAIRHVKGYSFWKNLHKAFKELGTIQEWAPLQLVKEPKGDFVKEKYGREIKGYWVDQRSVGDSGDSFEGTICIQIRENKYLKFHYSC